MISIHCTLVGFRHHAWRGTQLEERLARAIGREVVLMRDRENHRNPEAAIACIDSEVVAYVNNDDCHRIAAYLDATEYGLLYGVITAADAHSCRCRAEMEVDKEIYIEPLMSDGRYDEWDEAWSHIPIARLGDDELRQDMLQHHVLAQLSHHTAASDNLCRDIERYMQGMRYDLSGEASQTRRTIADRLLASGDEQLAEYGRRMDVAITEMGNNEVCADIAHHITRRLAQSAGVADALRHIGGIDRHEMEQALKAMPHGLHDEYRLSVADFVSRAYYLQIPRRILRRFVSAELLLDRLVHADAADGANEEIRLAAIEYISRANPYITPGWLSRADALWSDIIEQYALRLTRLNGAKDTRFNARFVCQVMGRLIDLGIYDDAVSQAEYGRRMALNGRDMRSSINRALIDDEETRRAIGMMVERYR